MQLKMIHVRQYVRQYVTQYVSSHVAVMAFLSIPLCQAHLPASKITFYTVTVLKTEKNHEKLHWISFLHGITISNIVPKRFFFAGTGLPVKDKSSKPT